MLKKIKRFFKHVTLLDPQYSLNVTIVLLLSVVSFYTSFDGLRHYMFGNDSESAPWSLLLLLAFLVFLIQLLLIVALMRLTQRISLGNKVSMLMLYLIAMGFSVFLSYSYWYQAIQADNYAYNNFNVQLDDSLSDVGMYQDTFSSIKKIATELAEYSQETALLEKNRGGTCGDNSSPGAGPRLSLRNNEESLFTLMNANISLLNDEVAQKINKLDSIRYGYSPNANIQELQKAMNVVIAEVNRYKQNPDLIKAKRQLKVHSGENRETLTTLHKDGTRTVSCPDAAITQKAQLLLTRINALPVLKNIRLFNSQDQREVMERALKVFVVIPSAVKNLLFSNSDNAEADAEEKSAEAVKSADFTPLILGAMIDLIIFFVGYGNGKYSQQRNYLSGKYHGQHFSVTDAIKINDFFNIDELRENLQWYHHQLGRKHLIIIPSDTYRQSQNSNKRDLVALMESLLANRRVSLQALRVPFDTLPKNMRRRFSTLPKDTLFEFYYTTEEQWFDLLQSLEADEILTFKDTDTQDFVLSKMESKQGRQEILETERSTLSLRKNVVTEEEIEVGRRGEISKDKKQKPTVKPQEKPVETSAEKPMEEPISAKDLLKKDLEEKMKAAKKRILEKHGVDKMSKIPTHKKADKETSIKKEMLEKQSDIKTILSKKDKGDVISSMKTKVLKTPDAKEKRSAEQRDKEDETLSNDHQTVKSLTQKEPAEKKTASKTLLPKKEESKKSKQQETAKEESKNKDEKASSLPKSVAQDDADKEEPSVIIKETASVDQAASSTPKKPSETSNASSTSLEITRHQKLQPSIITKREKR